VPVRSAPEVRELIRVTRRPEPLPRPAFPGDHLGAAVAQLARYFREKAVVADHHPQLAEAGVNETANKIVAVLKHPPLASTLRQHGSFEVRRMSCTDAARGCLEVYDRAIGAMSNGHG
jgi:hypothetical protein